jgi:uncharacterized protein YijF (DUF1287 family)
MSGVTVSDSRVLAFSRRAALLGTIGLVACRPRSYAQTPPPEANAAFPIRVAYGAELRALKPETYDPAYVKLAYPMGDVPDDRGVCTDTVIRAFRHAEVDLQVEVHEDMAANFDKYPKNWGLPRPDRNIDHRRVPNLETFFKRKGGAKTPSNVAGDYNPGDIVSWRLSIGGAPHIGVVTRKKEGAQPLIAHNIGWGTQEEPCLFSWPMSGWFRFASWA